MGLISRGKKREEAFFGLTTIILQGDKYNERPHQEGEGVAQKQTFGFAWT